MILKHQLDTLDGVDATLHQFYEQDASGKYFLQVQGMVAKSVHDEFRNNNIALTNKLKSFEGLDIAEYQRLKALESKMTTAPDQAAVEKMVQERTAAMRTEYEAKIGEYEKNTGTMKSQLEVLVIDNAVRAAATKVGVRAEAMDDVLLRAKTIYKFENGQAIPYDSKGQPIYGKDGQTPMNPEEWAGSLKKTAPHLFPGSTGTGAGGPGRGPNGMDPSKMSPTQKIASALASK